MQSMQAESAVLSVMSTYFPEGHSLQLLNVLLASKYVPSGQVMHPPDPLPPGLYFPASQVTHADTKELPAPPVDFPVAQAMQLDWPSTAW
jgi:hypothetical protein